MGPNSNLNYLLNHLAAVMGKQSNQLLQEQLGIGLSQYRILMVLEWNPRVQQKVIAESLGQTEASISRQIKLLKNKGLLISKQDPKNKRSYMSTPSPLGMQVTEAANGLLRRNIETDMRTLERNDVSKLVTELQKLHQIVCQPGQMGACNHVMDR